MPIQDAEIKAALEHPKKKQTIERAIRHENQIRFHAEIALDRATVSPYIEDFFQKVKGTGLAPAKFKNFESYFSYPVKTIEDTEKVFDHLYKVWDGQNPYSNYEFLNPENAIDWMEFQKEMKLMDKWKNEGWEVFKLAINSVVICDLPKVQTSKLPEPYFYFLEVCHLLEYQTDKSNNFIWCAFRIDDKFIAVFDDETYRTFYYPKNDLKEFRLEGVPVPHDLGYCPVSWFWKQPISRNNPDIKQSPLTTSLPALDQILKKKIDQQHLDGYAGYPVAWRYKANCDYRHQTGEAGYQECKRGFLVDQSGGAMIGRNGEVLQCPVCAANDLTGAGTLFNVPPPHEGTADMREPVGFIDTPIESLKYNVDEVHRIVSAFIQNVTGYAPDPINDQAVNEKQVKSMIEEPTAILRELKKGWETVIQWTYSTMCKLRYGTDFVECSYDMGTEFYLLDPDLLLSLYTETLGKVSQSVSDMLDKQYINTKYRNNPNELMREKIIAALDPLRHISPEKASGMLGNGIFSDEDIHYKLKFFTFVERFEREQAPLTEFGKNLDFKTRVNKIDAILKNYGKASIPDRSEIIEEGANAFAGGRQNRRSAGYA